MNRILNIFTKHKAKGYTLADQALLSGSSFLLTTLLARILGLEQVGIFTLIWIVVLFVMSINQAMIVSPMLIFGAKKLTNIDTPNYYTALFWLQIVLAFAFALSILLFYQFYIEIYPEIGFSLLNVKLTGIVFLVLVNDFFRKYFYLTKNHHKAIALDVLGYGMQILILFGFMFSVKLDLSIVFTIIFITQLIAFFFGLSQSHFFKMEIKNIRLVFRMHAKFSSWLVLAAIFQWFAGNVFLMVAAKLLNLEVLGAIRIMQNLIGVLNMVFISIENYVPTSAARIFQANGYQSLMRYITQILFKAGALLTLLLFTLGLVSQHLVGLVYGASYENYSYLLIGFTVLYFFVFISMNLRIGLRAMEITRPVFISYVMVSAVSLLIAKPLIIYSNGLGVIIGLTLAQIIMSVYYLWVLHGQKSNKVFIV